MNDPCFLIYEGMEMDHFKWKFTGTCQFTLINKNDVQGKYAALGKGTFLEKKWTLKGAMEQVVLL